MLNAPTAYDDGIDLFRLIQIAWNRNFIHNRNYWLAIIQGGVIGVVYVLIANAFRHRKNNIVSS